jgi:hypothetical protein
LILHIVYGYVYAFSECRLILVVLGHSISFFVAGTISQYLLSWMVVFCCFSYRKLSFEISYHPQLLLIICSSWELILEDLGRSIGFMGRRVIL